MRNLGISNLVATIILVTVAIALVIAIAAFVFGLLGNTTRYGANWLSLYESLYNNYTSLERNYTLLLKQYNELKSKYETLLSELKGNEGSQCGGITVNINGNYWGGNYVDFNSANSAGNSGGNGGSNETSNLSSMGYFMVYPDYFVYDISNITTYFIIITIHNELNESVTISNMTLYVDGTDSMNSSTALNADYPINATDDIVLTLFPGTDLGYVTSLGNYFRPLTLYFNGTISTNITSIGLVITYNYGNDVSTINYTLNIGGSLNNT